MLVVHLVQTPHDEGDYCWCGDVVWHHRDDTQATSHPEEVNCGACLHEAMEFSARVQARFKQLTEEETDG